jgi:hypothetical protein
VVLGQAEDIGPAGMMLRWPQDAVVRASSPLALSFVLPGGGQPIQASAQVVSERHSGRFRRTSVRFTALEPEHAALIADYCATRR